MLHGSIPQCDIAGERSPERRARVHRRSSRLQKFPGDVECPPAASSRATRRDDDMKSAQPKPAQPLVACIGEILWDCFPDRKVLGGAPLNCAYMAQCMGARALPISRVGDDPDGQAILQVMKDKRLDTSCVQVDPVHPTGIVRATRSSRTRRTISCRGRRSSPSRSRAATRSASERWPSAIPPAAPASCA
jgi:hypothetical protein